MAPRRKMLEEEKKPRRTFTLDQENIEFLESKATESVLRRKRRTENLSFVLNTVILYARLASDAGIDIFEVNE